MAVFTFIGFSEETVTTRRGELKGGIRLFYVTDLMNGTGKYGSSKLVLSERIAQIGMPEIGRSYEVSFNQWGNIESMNKVDSDVF